MISPVSIRPKGNRPRMENAPELKSEIISLIPSLRAFAYSLSRDSYDADDLVQETLAKALANIHRYESGTNMRAWLFTILRNNFYNAYHRSKREPTMAVEQMPVTRCKPEQEWCLKLKDVHSAVQQLPPQQREALMLVAGAGMSYIEASEILGCAIGTIKSRVNRARTQLLFLLDSESEADFLQEEAC